MNTSNQPARRTMKTQPIHKRSATCIAKTPIQLLWMGDRSKTADFHRSSISSLLTDPSLSGHYPTFAAAATGAFIGGTWGWIAGIGALIIPGLALLLAAGPVVCAMSGAAIGAVVGGVCGGFIMMGIPTTEPKRGKGKLLNDEILFSVPTASHVETPGAKDTFDNSRAYDNWGSNGRRTDEPAPVKLEPLVS